MAFPNNCDPRLITVDASCGCALTRADIRAFTPQDFEDQGFKEVGMDRIIAQTKEARMTGVMERTLTDLFLSRTAPVKEIKLTDDGSVIAPWIYRRQRHRINSNGFEIVSGSADPNAGVGSVHAGSWILIVRNEQSQFASPLVDLQKYFLIGRYISVLYRDATTHVGRTVMLKITASANADAGGVERAAVTVEPPFTAAGWTALSAGEKAIYHPEHGLLIPLANSVSDYESWCYQDPAENTQKLLVYWLQTIRETHCFNDEYLKALTAPLTSNYFKSFRQLPLAEQKRIQAMKAEHAYYNTLFFGDRVTEKQTVELYRELPQVVDPANTDCVLEYKANTLGFRTQLNDCGRVTDMEGAALDLDMIKSMIYSLKRHRESDSGQIVRIEAMTDRQTAGNILVMMIDYYKRKYQVETTRFYQPNQQLVFEKQVLFNYNVYQFPEDSVELAVITDPYFDDYLGMMPTDDKTRGRYFWMLDFSDITIGLARSASVERQTNIADNLYNCVIRPNVNHYRLTSKTVAAIIEDPMRHNLIENFSGDCPTITVNGCTASAS